MPPLSPPPGKVVPVPSSGNGVRDDRCYTSSHAVKELPRKPGRPEVAASRSYALPDPRPPIEELRAEDRLIALIEENNRKPGLKEVYAVLPQCQGVPRPGGMAPSPTASEQELRARIAGTWQWSNGATVTVSPDGTMRATNGHSGTWRVSDTARSAFDLNWTQGPTGPWYDKLTLSPDGNRLQGTNQVGAGISARKVSSAEPGRP
jgi:hypothetical protein